MPDKRIIIIIDQRLFFIFIFCILFCVITSTNRRGGPVAAQLAQGSSCSTQLVALVAGVGSGGAEISCTG